MFLFYFYMNFYSISIFEEWFSRGIILDSTHLYLICMVLHQFLFKSKAASWKKIVYTSKVKLFDFIGRLLKLLNLLHSYVTIKLSSRICNYLILYILYRCILHNSSSLWVNDPSHQSRSGKMEGCSILQKNKDGSWNLVRPRNVACTEVGRNFQKLGSST